MKGISKAVSATMLGLLMCNGAQAILTPGEPNLLPRGASTKVYTAPISPDVFHFDAMYCDAVNSRTKPLTMAIVIRNSSGQQVASKGPLTLAPGQGVSLLGPYDGLYCQFSVAGRVHDINAMAVYTNLGDGHYSITVPAQ